MNIIKLNIDIKDKINEMLKIISSFKVLNSNQEFLLSDAYVWFIEVLDVSQDGNDQNQVKNDFSHQKVYQVDNYSGNRSNKDSKINILYLIDDKDKNCKENKFIPFFSTSIEAQNYYDKLNISFKGIKINKISIFIFFEIAIKLQLKTCLNHSKYNEIQFNIDEMREIEDINNHNNIIYSDKIVQTDKLSQDHKDTISDKINKIISYSQLPSEFGQFLNISAKCFEEQLLIDRIIYDKSSMEIYNNRKAIDFFWRAFQSLAKILYFMIFIEKNISNKNLILETGLIVIYPENIDEINIENNIIINITDIIKRKFIINTEILYHERKILIKDILINNNKKNKIQFAHKS
jgi:hypothetical protein